MVKHVVMFKFKPEIDAGRRRQVLDELRDLAGKIEEIREFDVGEDVLHSPRSWDAVLISSFDGLQALDLYQRHEGHQQVAVKLKSISDAIAAVDYED
jgi:hypothetical protein